MLLDVQGSISVNFCHLCELLHAPVTPVKHWVQAQRRLGCDSTDRTWRKPGRFSTYWMRITKAAPGWGFLTDGTSQAQGIMKYSTATPRTSRLGQSFHPPTRQWLVHWRTGLFVRNQSWPGPIWRDMEIAKNALKDTTKGEKVQKSETFSRRLEYKDASRRLHVHFCFYSCLSLFFLPIKLSQIAFRQCGNKNRL